MLLLPAMLKMLLLSDCIMFFFSMLSDMATGTDSGFFPA